MGVFLAEAVKTNPRKCEYVLPCEESWYGVTYRGDLASVKQAVAKMKADGIYTKELWT